MLEQSATVVDVIDGRVIIEVLPESTCGSCAVKQGCGTAVLSGSVGRKLIRIELEDTLGTAAGERVVLGIPEDAIVKGSLLMYLVPLLLMFLCALITDNLLPANDPLRDLKVAMAAATGLGASIFLGRRVIRPAGSNYQPVLLRKDIAVRSENAMHTDGSH